MDYNKLCDDLESHQNEWFKPTAGTYKCLIVEEPKSVTKTFHQGTDKEETRNMLSIKMEVEGKGLVQWDVGVTKGFSSAYGQLVLLGKKHGTLCGAPFTLMVKRSNDKNDYTIIESLPLMPQKKGNV